MKVPARAETPRASEAAKQPARMPSISLATLVAIVLALLILGVILVPAGTWHQPTTDQVYTGFDSNLMSILPTGPGRNTGDIAMSHDQLSISARPGSHPTVHLLTTPLSFSASFDAKIIDQQLSTVPLQIELWSPETSSGYFIVFDGSGILKTETVERGQSLQDLVGGTAVSQTILGQYLVGQLYHFRLDFDQPNRRLNMLIEGPSVHFLAKLTTVDAPELFKAFRYALTVSSSSQLNAGVASSHAIVRNLSVTLPHQSASSTEETIKVDDSRVRTLALALWVASVVVCIAVGIALAVPRVRRAPQTWLPAMPRLLQSNRSRIVLLAAALGVYLAGNALLFGVAVPHYDMVSSKIWAYDAYRYGITDLYYRTLLVPAAAASNGVPMHEAGFPYGITKAYYYLSAAWIYHVATNPFRALSISSFGLEALLKALNVVLGFADGLLVYFILQPLVGKRAAFISSLALVLNPAVLMVMSLWGSTETVSLFFVLGSILLAERQRPLGAWLMLAAAAYTRPQMLVVAFLLGAIYLRKFGVARNLAAIPWTVIIAFVFMGPFAIGISPSLPVDYVARIFAYHIGNGQADLNYLGVSPANYSVWTVPLLFVSRQYGLYRMWAPSTMPFIGSVSYGQAGAALSIGLLVGVAAVLFFKQGVATQPRKYLPLLAFAMLGWTLLTPGVMSRYMVYALVTLILCRVVFSLPGYLWLVAAVSAIASVSIYLHLANDFLGYSGGANVLSPMNNAVSGLLYSTFSSDWFITFVSLVNVLILLALGWKALETLRVTRATDERATAAAAAI